MKQANSRIHNRSRDLFSSISGDQALFNRIVEDMLKHAGKLSPISGWHFLSAEDESLSNENKDKKAAERYTAKDFDTLFSTSDKILEGWIGSNGKVGVTDEDIAKWRPFLEKIDHLGLLPAIENEKDRIDFRLTDLGSVMDVNLIGGMINEEPHELPLKVIEIGGGYGRLAEALMNIYPGQLKYVMLDVVPASLMFAYLYLTRALPNCRVGIYYLDPSCNLDSYDIYIAPAWHFEKDNTHAFDVAVNTESMQEMNQEHVDHYLGLFDRVLKQNGLVYLSNAHDWYFKGSWNHADHWEKIFCSNTPRSWSPNHPTEIYRKRARSFTWKNSLITAGYDYQLNKLWRLTEQNDRLLGSKAIRLSQRVNHIRKKWFSF